MGSGINVNVCILIIFLLLIGILLLLLLFIIIVVVLIIVVVIIVGLTLTRRTKRATLRSRKVPRSEHRYPRYCSNFCFDYYYFFVISISVVFTIMSL